MYSDEIERTQAEKIRDDLSVIRHFMKYREYRAIRTACNVKLHGKIKHSFSYGIVKK